MTKYLASVLILFFLGFSAYAQRTISGVVKGENDVIGLEGVNVQLNGQTIGTTDFEGAFQVNVPEGNVTLIFVLDGYQSFSFDVTSNSNIQITLSKSVGGSTSDNVLSVGYGTQSKDESTGSIASIESEGLSAQPVVSLEQANQGRASGVLVQNTGGELGAGASVRIRGGSSLTSSNQPLFVVDGVPLTSGSQSDINPNNIKSIEVLKDASATSIYGARAANGVILITTKSGASGKMKVEIDYQFGVSETPKRLELYDSDDFSAQALERLLRENLNDGFIRFFLSLEGVDLDVIDNVLISISDENLRSWSEDRVITSNNGSTIPFDNTGSALLDALFNAYDLVDGQFIYETDWQDQVFRSGISHRANLGISGGTDGFNYFAGVSYFDQEGIVIGNDFNRLNAQVNLGADLSDKLKLTLALTGATSKNNRLNDGFDLGHPLKVLTLPPGDEPDPNNSFDLKVSEKDFFYNPQTEIEFSEFLEERNLVIGNLGTQYQISDKLKANVDFGFDILDERVERRQGPETLDGVPNGRSRLTEVSVLNYLVNGYLEYSTDLDRSKLQVLVGSSYQNSETSVDFRLARVNSISDLEALGTDSPELLNNAVPGSANALLSAFSRINYNIDEKYLFQFSSRIDGSSRFSESNRYGFFPAASFGWNLSNEGFLANNGFIDQLKFKVSYGIIGNTPDDDFLYQANLFQVKYGDQVGFRFDNVANKDLKWESTAQLDVGLDFAILDNRVGGSIGWYQKETSDLLFPRPITPTSGFSTVIDNIATMTNKGWELTLSTVNVQNSKFSWVTEFNITNNTNEVTDLGGQNLIIGVNAYLEGQPASVFYMPKYLGVDPNTGASLYDNGFGGETTDYQEAFENGRMAVGNPNPDYFGGITNSLTYGNFSLNFIFQFVQGVDIYNQTGEEVANSGYLGLSQLKSQVDRWYQPGDVDAANPVLNVNSELPEQSSRWLEDGSYIRLNNISLSYEFPSEMMDRMGLSGMNLSVGGQNIVTFTDYTGYDPDVNYISAGSGTIGQNLVRGIDNFSLPQPRIITTTLKIRF